MEGEFGVCWQNLHHCNFHHYTLIGPRIQILLKYLCCSHKTKIEPSIYGNKTLENKENIYFYECNIVNTNHILYEFKFWGSVFPCQISNGHIHTVTGSLIVIPHLHHCLLIMINKSVLCDISLLTYCNVEWNAVTKNFNLWNVFVKAEIHWNENWQKHVSSPGKVDWHLHDTNKVSWYSVHTELNSTFGEVMYAHLSTYIISSLYHTDFLKMKANFLFCVGNLYPSVVRPGIPTWSWKKYTSLVLFLVERNNCWMKGVKLTN
jgi:hypothetical protein